MRTAVRQAQSPIIRTRAPKAARPSAQDSDQRAKLRLTAFAPAEHGARAQGPGRVAGESLSQRLQTERAWLESDLEKLRLALEETKRLWRPYRLVLRWLRHPLVIALLGSYRRRLLR